MNPAVDHNSAASWDRIWKSEGEDTWRTYPLLYGRIVQLTPLKSAVFDVGCGVGKLLDKLQAERGCTTAGCDTSAVAVTAARAKGHQVYQQTVGEEPTGTAFPWDTADCIVATELLEHLPTPVLEAFLVEVAKTHKRAIFAVPNNCLGPDEEPQHHQKWTAIAFKRLLARFFTSVRVECIDDGAPRLIGVCNELPRPYKLAFTMPVKNEADDIERVLKSFRGACDFLVIGIDDTSTDQTEALARLYADEVFSFHWENDFSKARNACIEQCRPHLAPTDWIFMSEGHEHLEAGLDSLLNLDLIPTRVHVLEVRREDRDHAWMFPWLFRNRPEISFVNAVHNSLVWDDERSQVAQLPAVRTWHARSHRNALERIQQRRQMNRQELAKRLARHPNDSRSCYYLANEWRRDSPDKAIQYYRRYLAMPRRNGPERYQARLSMAECLIRRVHSLEELKKDAPSNHVERLQQEALQEVYDTLIVASGDDWSRNEHWIYLGDLCAKQGNRFEQAMRFYELAAVSINREPLTFMWVEKANYSWVPAQKLVSVYAEAGMLKEALHWCDRLADLLPVWAPQEARDEVQEHRLTIITKLKEAGST